MSDQKPDRPRFEVAAISAKQMFLQVADEGTWNKEIGFALQILRGSDLLQKCDPTSVRNAVTNLALTGATLNPALAQAYLVPRDGKCCLDFSYRGLLKIATDSGGVKSIQAAVVYDFDVFDYEEGTESFIRHKRNLDPPADFKKDPLAGFWPHFLCAFSIATLHDGTKDYMILPKWRIDKIRNTSKVKSDKGPWGQWPEEMARKTVIKYHYKTLPQTDRMSTAVSVLNEHEGLDIEQSRREVKQEFLSRFAGAEDAILSGENVEAVKTDEAKPEPCEICEQVGGHTKGCSRYVPTDADLFGNNEK